MEKEVKNLKEVENLEIGQRKTLIKICFGNMSANLVTANVYILFWLFFSLLPFGVIVHIVTRVFYKI